MRFDIWDSRFEMWDLRLELRFEIWEPSRNPKEPWGTLRDPWKWNCWKCPPAEKHISIILLLPDLYIGYISMAHMGTFKLHIRCTQVMCCLQYRWYMNHFQCTQRGQLAAPLHISLAWFIYGLYCRLNMACVQLMCSLKVPICCLDM